MQLKNRRQLNRYMTNYLDMTLLSLEFIEQLCTADIEDPKVAYLDKVEKLNEMVFYVENPPTAIG